MKEHDIFPYGVFIGEMENSKNKFPFLIDSKKGGFCVLFDDESEITANTFIENITINLLDIMAYKRLKIKLFDFGKNRFLYLSTLKDKELFDIEYSRNIANKEFDKLEEILQYRNHNLLNYEIPTLNDYNKNHDKKEEYYLILINLDSFPDDDIYQKRIQNFIESSFEAGYFIIPFANKNRKNKNKSTKVILDYYKDITIENNNFKINNDLYPIRELDYIFNFSPININQEKIIKNILEKNKRLSSNLKNFHIELKHSAISNNYKKVIEPKIEPKIRMKYECARY
jgi:hypothetical protein